MVHITQWRIRSASSLIELRVDWGAAQTSGGLGIGAASVLTPPIHVPATVAGQPAAFVDQPVEAPGTGEQVLIKKVKLLKQRARALPAED
eukprot:6398086-Amphidinium_carterae.1